MAPAINFMADHLKEVIQVYVGNISHDEAWRKLQDQIPGLSSETSFSSFKQYAGIILKLNTKINILEMLNTELNNSDKLNSVKQELEKAKQEINRLQMLNNLLNSDEMLNSVKQELEIAKQKLNIQEELNILLNNTVEMLNNDKQLNMINKQDEPLVDKQKINIAGWSVQKSGGFYRAFRRIGGKMCGVYLGKTLDGAETKIKAKAESLNGDV